jgi:hypothetical protein
MSDQYKIYDVGYGRRDLMKQPFIVATPKAYIIDLASFPETEEETKEGMLKDVDFLRDILRLLGISETEAYKKDYTLNKRTGEELAHIAHMQGKTAAWQLINGHRW